LLALVRDALPRDATPKIISSPAEAGSKQP